MSVPAGLRAWAELSGPAALLVAVRRRAERGQHTEQGALRLDLTERQRREVGQLLGIDWVISGRAVRLHDLAAKLAEHGLTARDLVVELDGRPIRDRRAEHEAQVRAASIERARAISVLRAAGVAEAAADTWLSEPGIPPAGDGQLAVLAGQVATVWSLLPRPGSPPPRLARLAAEALHDAHALDAASVTGRAVVRLVAVVHGVERPRTAGQWRTAWAAAGVLCDSVSSRVLALNLPLTGPAPAARWCRAAPGEPLWLTLRSLSGSWSAAACTVFVCENATVVEAAADVLGARCSPLVCTDGIASTAALELVARLAEAGCTIRARADFDPAGFTVFDQIRSVAPSARSWRFDAATYLATAGADAEPAPGDDGLPQLRATYGRLGVAVHEERLLGDLLNDLTQ